MDRVDQRSALVNPGPELVNLRAERCTLNPFMHAPGGQDPGLAPVLAKEINIKKFHSDIVCKDIKLKNNSSTGE